MSEQRQPDVRFQGFCRDWERQILGNVLDGLYNGQTPSRYCEDFWNGDINWLTSGELNRSIIKATVEKITPAGQKSANLRIVPKNTFIMAITGLEAAGTRGNCGIIDIDTTLNQSCMALFPNKEMLDTNFLFQWYNLVSEHYGTCFTQGTKQQSYNAQIIKKLNISVPKVAEQTKIGELFKNIDNLIVLNQSKYDKLVSMKKACLEKMFPKDGADTPEIRFKGFSGKWKQCKIKEVCSISTGKSNTQDRIEDGKYPFYVRSPIVERSNRYLFDEEAVLTVGDGVGTGKVFHYVHGKYDLHQRVYRMFGFKIDMLPKYFYFYFSVNFYNRVMSMTAKTSVDSVRLEMISEMDIVYPEKEEQKNIVEYLEGIDKLIDLSKTELEKLKNIKKALLEKMFI